MFDEAALKPRQWIYGQHYLRGFVSVLASAGGVGKTSACRSWRRWRS
jgi:hypothetical protein